MESSMSAEGLEGLLLEGNSLTGTPNGKTRPTTSKRVTISGSGTASAQASEVAREPRREMKSATGFPNALRTLDDIPKKKGI
jgi:hypothetical protein